ncbi:MAG: serine protease [Solirubrobacteraceae bacterium]|nr:serine protease [Solirubrobacteraceae bacterium]
MHRTAITILIATVALACGASSAAAAPIHPGVQTFTAGGQCTANFIFRDGSNTYIGQAAHCSGTGGSTATDGCQSGSLPLGTPVRVTGATRPGTLAYNSWLTMQDKGETNADACQYNDFALVRLDPADVPDVDSSVPGFGGPTSVGGAGRLEAVYSYGNSSLRAGITALSPKQGVVLTSVGDGWSRTVLTVTPGIPGDSGSGFLNASGQAIGVLSTLSLAPVPATNGVGDLGLALSYMRANAPSFSDVQLVPGTTPFKGNLLGAILGL